MNFTPVGSFKFEMENELYSILTWWMTLLIDDTNGGFYGKVDGNSNIHPEADKGVIMSTRILWTFSAAYLQTQKKEYLETAKWAYDYLIKYFLDKKNGGLFWMLDYKGNPVVTKKQIYAQAFGIYGLTEYYKITKNKDVLDLALNLFQYIEEHSLDKMFNGYFEAFTEDWKPIDDLRLSEKDANEAKTMNTHLHILEAYTNLYKVAPHADVKRALHNLIECYLDKFIDKESYHLHLFFDEKWNSKSEIISYGHDIETSWLLLEAVEALGNETFIDQVKILAEKMAQVTMEQAIDKGSGLIYEKEHNEVDKEKHWWVQAEAVIGFYNAYQISKKEEFLDASLKCWTFIKNKIRDDQNGEWHWSLDKYGNVNRSEDKAGPWKSPYHNGRMCIEMSSRIPSTELV